MVSTSIVGWTKRQQTECESLAFEAQAREHFFELPSSESIDCGDNLEVFWLESKLLLDLMNIEDSV